VKRGEFVTVALQGDFGKPRPALIIQADRFDQTATMTILPVTSDLVDARSPNQGRNIQWAHWNGATGWPVPSP
jgi:mRNA-degrading endonuclease toxin of MazEF toxin-antitoxin module